jgi:hypothetical protein
VVLKTVKISVAKVGENVSKKNMNPRGEDKISGTLVIQQPFEGPPKREDTRAFDEPMLSSLKHSLTTNGTISVYPHLL